MYAALALGRRLSMGKTQQSRFVDAAEFAIELGALHVRFASAATALGYLAVESRPVRVRSCTWPLSTRAAMQKPSSFICICTHCAPEGGFSTGWRVGEGRTAEGHVAARPTGLDGLRDRTLD
jgi:hypothetical protein